MSGRTSTPASSPNCSRQGEKGYRSLVPYAKSFGDVQKGSLLLYLNSLMQVSFALNQGNLAEARKIEAGPDWVVTITRVDLHMEAAPTP